MSEQHMAITKLHATRALSKKALRVFVTLLLLVVAVFAAPACETYDSPPRVFVIDLVDGNLPDNKAPIVIQFSEPVDAATLSLKVILLETDTEGNLFDEDADDAKDAEGKKTELSTFFVHEAGSKEDEGGKGELSKDRLTYTITLNEPLPVGPALALLIEPGLADDQGVAWEGRQRINFGYRFTCSDGGVSQIFESGAYFFVANVEKPLPTQLQLIVWFDVDPVTGVVTGQFTNADRFPGPTCGCPEDDGCSSVGEKCVLPSQKAGDEEEYGDFLVPNFEPPEGYTFRASVCAVDQPDGTVAFANAPVDVAIEQPEVTVVATRLTAQFVKGADGVLRCSGSVTGEDVILGSASTGPASGTFVGRKIPDDQVPETIPKP